MRNRSIAGFIMGLLPGILFLFISFYLVLIFGIIETSVSSAGGDISGLPSFIAWATAFGSVFSIIGAAMCFKKAKLGGVFMLIAFGLLCVLPGYVLATNGNSMMTLMMFWFVPLFVLLVGAICALSAKKVPINAQPQQVAAPEYTRTQSFCAHCGAKMEGTFCSNCGAKKGE